MSRLTEALRNHDPAASAGLTPAELAKLRRALDAPPARSAATLRAAGALAVMLLVVLFLAALWGERPHRDAEPVAREAAPGDPTRQIQMTSPGGTRVIWVFNDDFRM